MKNLITILLLFVSVISFSQDEYFRTVDWKFYPGNVTIVAQDTYLFDAEPIDFNDPAAIERTVGNYVVDFVGRRYLVIDSTSTTLTVFDEYGTGQAPQSSQIARCYRSVGDGEAEYIGSVDYSTLDLSARWKINGADNELLWQFRSAPHDSITFKPDVDYTNFFTEYTFKLDTANRTIVMTNDESEIAMQLGQELWLEIKNGNGVTFDNGALVYIIEGSDNGKPIVMLADNRDFETVDAVGMLTHDVEAGTFGFTTVYGNSGGHNTLGTVEGQKVYVDTTGGVKNWTTTVPSFPSHEFEIGFISLVDEFEGKIFLNPKGQVDDILHNLNNANLTVPFDFRTSSDGVTVTGTLSSPTGADYITVRWSDGFQKIDVPQQISIPQGTDNASQFSVVYLEKSTGLIATSTTYFPLTSELKTIAKLETWTAAKTLAFGQKGNQNYNDYLASVNTGIGRIAQIGKWQRLQPLKFVPESGSIGSMAIQNVSGLDSVKFALTQGVWSQANEQVQPAYDMELGHDIHIFNYPDHADTTVMNLANVLIDAQGNSLAGRSWTWVFWLVQNKTGEPFHIYCNLPNGSYSSSASAITDAIGYKVKSIPYRMQSYSGFLYEAVMTHTNPGGGTWTLQLLSDIKGDYPFSGGSSGSPGGVLQFFTDLLDTPGSYVGEGSKLLQVDPLESAVSFIAKSDIPLTDLDSTGFTLEQDQIVGLVDSLASIDLQYVTDISGESSNIISLIGTNFRPLILERTAVENVVLGFEHPGGLYNLGFDTNERLTWGTSNDAASNDIIWHEGNFIAGTDYEVPLIFSTGLTRSVNTITTNDSEIDHNATLNYVLGQHRIINDGGTSSTELWSANKINSEIGSIVSGVSSVNSLTGDVLIGLSNLDDYTTTDVITADAFRTNSSNTEHNLFTRTGSTASPVYIQQGNASGHIASFQYGSAIVNSGTEVMLVEHTGVDINGTLISNGVISALSGNSTQWNLGYDHSLLTSGNPHDIDANDVGLGNVENAAASTLYEPLFSKNTGFNKDFGTITGTVAQGDDSRFTDARATTSNFQVVTDNGGLSDNAISLIGTNFRPLIMERTNAENVVLGFTHLGGTYNLGMSSNEDLTWGTSNDATSNDIIWHAGNSNTSLIDWAAKDGNFSGEISTVGMTSTDIVHVDFGASGATANASSRLIIEDNTTAILQLLTPNTNVQGIMFGDPENQFAGYIRYSHSDNTMKLYNNGAINLTLSGTSSTFAGANSASSYTAATGATINEFSTDGTLVGNSDTAVPTEKAVKTYVDAVAANRVLPMRIVTASTTVTTADYTVYFTQATPSGQTVTFPTASSNTGYIFIIVNSGLNSLASSNYQPIGAGGAITSIAAATSIMIQSNGSFWFRIR